MLRLFIPLTLVLAFGVACGDETPTPDALASFYSAVTVPTQQPDVVPRQTAQGETYLTRDEVCAALQRVRVEITSAEWGKSPPPLQARLVTRRVGLVSSFNCDDLFPPSGAGSE